MWQPLVVLAAWLSSGALQDPTEGALAIVHVNVLPMTADERVLEDHAVLIRDGRIAAVAPTSELELPAGCRIVEGAGRFLLPGLTDMHVHVTSEDDLLLDLAAGVTSVRNMWGLPMHLAMQERIEDGSLLGPTLYTTGPITDGVPPGWDGSVGVDGAEVARAEVLRQKEAGFEAVKVYNGLGEEAYVAIVDTAHEEGMRVTGHVPDAVGIRTALEIGQDCIEHLEGYFPSMGAAPAGDEAELVRLTVEAGTWNCVTLVVMRNISMLGDPAALKARPEMRYVSPATRASWDPATDWRFKNVPPGGFEGFRARVHGMQAFTLALHQAGAGILVGTDTPNPYVVPGFAVHDELALLVEAGFTPYEALDADTAQAATYLGRRTEFGRIVPGLRADLLLLRENPLEDIARTRERAGVVVRGRWLPQEELDRRLEELASSFEEEPAFRAAALELPDEGDTWIEGRYERLDSGVAAGEEHVAVRRLARGRYAVHSHAVGADGSETILRQELDEGLLDTSFTYRAEQHGTQARIEGRRDGERMAITVEPDGSMIPPEIAMDRDTLPYLPGCGSLQVLALRLRTLDAGDEWRFSMVELDPEVGVTVREYVARALSPAPGATTRSYRIETPSRARLIELETDVDGRLIEARIQLQVGSLGFSLLD